MIHLKLLQMIATEFCVMNHVGDTLFRWKLLYKKLKDMSLITKLRLCMFLIAGCSILPIGIYSYRTARDELIRNAETSVLNLQEQSRKYLDDRVKSFEDSSFQILSASNIEKLFSYSAEQAEANKVVNEGLPTVITMHAVLSNYTEYALLRPGSNVVYNYYRGGVRRLGTDREKELLDQLDELVDLHHIKRWVRMDGVVYFVRQVVDTGFQETGILCFAVNEEFFRFLGDEESYLSDERAFVLNRQDDLLYGSAENLQQLESALVSSGNNGSDVNAPVQFAVDDNGERLSVTILDAEQCGWTLISYFPYSLLLAGIRHIITRIVLVIVLVILLITIATWLISNLLSENVKRIESGMKHFEEGDFQYRISPAGYDEVGLLGLQLNHMAVRIQELIIILQEKEEEKKRLEIETLQAQINPHFLYNTLGSLRWAAFRNGQKDLANALDALTQLLRFTIKKANSMVTVSEEMDYIRNYVAIEKMRYGDCFDVEYQIDGTAAERLIPGFILQPLVENSILHGLDQTRPGGRIMIRAFEQDTTLFLEVEDNGMGIPEEELPLILSKTKVNGKSGMNSIGMKIVDERLHDLYGDSYRTVIESREGEGTRVCLKIPRQDTL